jgi:hypothetical protein
MVGPTPSISPVFGRYCSQVVPNFGGVLVINASLHKAGAATPLL